MSADAWAAEADSRTAPDLLAWAQDLVDPALRSALDELPASVRGVAAYHFG